MEKKQFNCKLMEVKVSELSEKYFTFEGYASTFGNTDRGNDIVSRGAFSDSIREMASEATPISGTEFSKLMPVLWQHNWDEPIGSFVEMREDDRGLFVKGILPKSDDFVRGRVIPQMEAGSISDMSIGFMIEEQTYNGEVRNIDKVKLYETSLVTIPMNPKAKVTSFKSLDNIPEMDVSDYSQEWDDNQGIKGAYLDEEKVAVLNITNKINDKEFIVPSAVHKASIDIQLNDDLKVLKGDIEKVYDRMSVDSPFSEKNILRIDNAKSITDREMESLLRSGVCFSKSFAKQIIKLLNDEEQRDADAKSLRDAELRANLEKLLKTL